MLFSRIVGTASIPKALSKDIDFVVGISELLEGTRITPKVVRESADEDQLITPSVLKEYPR